MKTRYVLFLLLTLSYFSKPASAQIFASDSAYANFILAENNVENAAEALGRPKGRLAHLIPGGEFQVVVLRPDSSIHPLVPGARVIVYGQKDNLDDSSAAEVSFVALDKSFVRLYESKAVKITGGANVVTVEDKPYTVIQIRLAGGGTPGAAVGYYVDGVVVVQPFSGIRETLKLQERSFSTFPNPLKGSSKSTLHVHFDKPTKASILITDVNGKNVMALDAGLCLEGDHEFTLQLPNPGVYFARLVMDDFLSARPFKISVLP
jgi:hypothetical protein